MINTIVVPDSQMKTYLNLREKETKKVWTTPSISNLSTQFTYDISADCANLGKVVGNEDALTDGGANVCGTIPTS
jgi:hypothetical protein